MVTLVQTILELPGRDRKTHGSTSLTSTHDKPPIRSLSTEVGWFLTGIKAITSPCRGGFCPGVDAAGAAFCKKGGQNRLAMGLGNFESQEIWVGFIGAAEGPVHFPNSLIFSLL